MKNKLLFGIALCLGLCSMASAQFGGPGGRNNGQTTEDPAGPGGAGTETDDPAESTTPTRPGGNIILTEGKILKSEIWF